MSRKARSAHPPIPPSASFIGVDAGGSHTEAVVIDAKGHELARAEGGPGAINPQNIPKASRTIAGVVRDALKKARVKAPAAGLVVGAAGAGRPASRAALERALKALKLARKTRVVTDGEIALAGAFPDGAGIVLISGTGSVAFGRDTAGSFKRTGGLGWQLGDEGGGYAIGRMALAAAGRALDGRGMRTSLGDGLLAATGSANLDALVGWAQTADRVAVATLTRPTFQAAEQGDPVARQIVESAASDLVSLVLGLLIQFGPAAPHAIALAGSLLTSGTPLLTDLVSSLRRAAPGLRLREDPPDPALGAARFASGA